MLLWENMASFQGRLKFEIMEGVINNGCDRDQKSAKHDTAMTNDSYSLEAKKKKKTPCDNEEA